MTEYAAPRLYLTPHIETIIPALLRRVDGITYQRERIITEDNDFLDLDWIQEHDTKELVIISHGLEGDSHRPYVRGMARAFSLDGFNVLAWNFRGCSGEINKNIRFYHSGATDDLHRVVNHAISAGYTSITLVGFSLGGNLTLKYLGEANRPSEIKQAVAFSVPLDLYASCIQISKKENWMYARRFLRHLKAKIRQKADQLPGELDTAPLEDIDTLIAFDDTYTSVLHGFQNARDYYDRCSAIKFMEGIDRPVLLVNALNDPFLPDECYPTSLKSHRKVVFLTPDKGGHVGFTTFGNNGLYWSEKIAVDFVRSVQKHSINNFIHS